jgi:hypothetical protein
MRHCNATDHNIENGIDDLALIELARSPLSFGFGQQLFNILPVKVARMTRKSCSRRLQAEVSNRTLV